MADKVPDGESMVKERIVKEDGRYLIFYSFRPEARAGRAQPADAGEHKDRPHGGLKDHV